MTPFLLAVPPRHVLGVIGPNGAGKTTLLNVLCGFILLDACEVLFGGRQQTSGRIGLPALACQNPAGGRPVQRLTALENVMVGATSRASAGSGRRAVAAAGEPRRAQAARPGPGCPGPGGAAQAAQARPGELSYGMRKRVAPARRWWPARADPLDEPASGLDESELAELGDLIRGLATEGSLVVVEHHMDLMMSVCDSIVGLDFGK